MKPRTAPTPPALRRASPYTPPSEVACTVDSGTGASLDDLLVQVAYGGRTAFSTLYDLTAPMLWRIAERHTAEQHPAPGPEAEEKLLAMYTRIWQRAPSYRPGNHALAWIIHEAQTAGEFSNSGATS